MQMNWQLSANENQSALTHTVSQKMTNSDIEQSCKISRDRFECSVVINRFFRCLIANSVKILY